MISISTTWLQTYLLKLVEHPQFMATRSVAPLWLIREGAEQTERIDLTPSAARVTIQMAAELFPRLALIGPAGSGKTVTHKPASLPIGVGASNKEHLPGLSRQASAAR